MDLQKQQVTLLRLYTLGEVGIEILLLEQHWMRFNSRFLHGRQGLKSVRIP